MSLLEKSKQLISSVEPDCWRKNESVQWDSRIHTTITHKSEFPEKVARLFNSPLYSRETVESLLSQCRKEARKQVLLEAAEYCDELAKLYPREDVGFDKGYSMCATRAANELRRMAESTMEGEKE